MYKKNVLLMIRRAVYVKTEEFIVIIIIIIFSWGIFLKSCDSVKIAVARRGGLGGGWGVLGKVAAGSGAHTRPLKYTPDRK